MAQFLVQEQGLDSVLQHSNKGIGLLLFVVGPDLGPNFQDGRLVGPISGPERHPGTSLTILESLEWVETRFWVHLGVPRPQNCHQGREIYLYPPLC